MVAAVLSLVGGGCGNLNDPEFKWPWEEEKPVRPEPPTSVETGPLPASVAGTVRSVAYVEGLRKLRVRGYGVVGGLANTGGKDVPAEIRRYLEAEIRRRSSADDLQIDPKEILDSPRYAAVSVTADIPAAATRGSRFDLLVQALGNQTSSLEDGVLYPCDLKLYQPTSKGVIEGKAVATAEGPIYLVPFGASEGGRAATPANRRSVRVIGGGTVMEDRRLRLILNTASYANAARIRERLNSRFGGRSTVADAVSPTTIRLTIPEDYRGDAQHFVDLVLSTLIEGNPTYLQQRAAKLAEEILHPLADYDAIALVWEAIGKSVLPTIQPLYDHRSEAVSFHAARAGLRLGDSTALEKVALHAGKRGSAFRELAVGELAAGASVYRGAERVRRLLSADDPQVRIAAYEGLLQRGDRAIRSIRVGDGNFILDVVESDGAPLIYVKQQQYRRIAVFGRGAALQPPAMYSRADELVTISANAGDLHATVVRRNPLHGTVSDPIQTSLEATELVRFLGSAPKARGGVVQGVGLSYAAVVDALYHLTQDRTLPAVMILERPRLTDYTPRSASRERRESEVGDDVPERGDEPAPETDEGEPKEAPAGETGEAAPELPDSGLDPEKATGDSPTDSGEEDAANPPASRKKQRPIDDLLEPTGRN